MRVDRFARTKIFAVIFTIVTILVFWFSPASRPVALWGDFNAFYCAGRLVNLHQNPYKAEPLGACERAPRPALFKTVKKHLTLPAPLPPYDFTVFRLFALLPYAWAGAVWTALIAFCAVATGRALHRLSGLSTIAGTALCVPTVAFSAGVLGEMAPVAIAAIAWSACALSAKRPREAAFFALIGMVQPHVGLGAVVALFLCDRRTRSTLFGGTLVLGFWAISNVGFSSVIEYFTHVLPQHAIAEIPSTEQISLTALLAAIGAPHAAAAIAGSFCYIAMLVYGVALAYRLKRARPDDGLIVALPVAFALLGGVFMHVTQLPAALPCTLTVWSRSRGTQRTILAIAAGAIAVPWVHFGFLGPGFAIVAGAAIAVASAELFDFTIARALATAGGVAFFIIALDVGMLLSGARPPITLPAIRPNDLPEVNWGRYIGDFSHFDPSLYTLARLPSWIGTLAMVLFASRVALRAVPLAAHENENETPNLRVAFGSPEASQTPPVVPFTVAREVASRASEIS